jgi:hypothetical protein
MRRFRFNGPVQGPDIGNLGVDHARVGSVPVWLPAGFRTVPYVGARFPGSPAEPRRPGLADGANCQLFAYEVLKLFGLDPPALRSSELWADMASTSRVVTVQPLDLILVNATGDPWGAHVGVWIDDDQILHLCAEIGRPAVWRMDDFAARPRYRTLVGIKRVVRRTG